MKNNNKILQLGADIISDVRREPGNIIIILLCIILNGCYSFRGGSVPEYIKTVEIKPVADLSGFGNPDYKDYFLRKITDVIRKDNSLKIDDDKPDSRLTVKILSIKEDVTTTTAGSQVEKERKLTVNCSIEFYDNINSKTLAEKNDLSINQTFLISGLPGSRNEAANKCFDILADEIMNTILESGE